VTPRAGRGREAGKSKQRGVNPSRDEREGSRAAPPLEGAVAHLKQVFLNLLRNSLQAEVISRDAY
jgi:hypothetical protein